MRDYQAMADSHPRLTLVDEEYLENTEREEEVLDIEINNGPRPVLHSLWRKFRAAENGMIRRLKEN